MNLNAKIFSFNNNHNKRCVTTALRFYSIQSKCNTNTRHLSSSSIRKPNEIKLGFLGTGKIAQALILGLLNRSILKADQIYVNDENKEYLMHLKEKNPLFQVKFYVFTFSQYHKTPYLVLWYQLSISNFLLNV